MPSLRQNLLKSANTEPVKTPKKRHEHSPSNTFEKSQRWHLNDIYLTGWWDVFTQQFRHMDKTLKLFSKETHRRLGL